MTSPAISIIVPVYNAASTLEATISSVLAQSFGDFELLLVDDGSSDESLDLICAAAARDQRVRAIGQENRGVAATRNLGVELSRAPLIAFLDADDLWEPEKLARHAEAHARDPQLGASFARIAFIDPQAGSGDCARTLSTVHDRILTVTELLAENPVCTMSNLFVTREAFLRAGPFRKGMSFAEDQEWLVRAAHAGIAIRAINEVLVNYRLSPDGLSVNLEKMYHGWRLLAGQYQAAGGLASAEAVYCRYLVRRALRSGARPSVALNYVRRGLALDARSFLSDARRGWLTLISAFAACFLPREVRLRLFA